jgi:hypothetical protein
MFRLLSIALAALIAAPAAALGPVAFGPDPAAAGWETLSFRGRAPAEFRAQGADTLNVRAEQGVSVLWRALPETFRDASGAEWRWRVDTAVPPSDLGRRGGDRSLALYFVFSEDAATPPRSLRAALRNGRALVYVWGGASPRRSVVREPSLRGRGLLVIQEPAGGPVGAWQTEAVDLREDFRRAFGEAPGALIGVAVSADSDDTGTVADATISGLRLR